MSKFKWNYETIHAEALKYTLREDFKKKSNTAYKAARKLDIYEQVSSHMPSTRKQRTERTKTTEMFTVDILALSKGE